MNKEIIEQWELNKNKLRKYFETTEQKKYSNYKEIVKVLIKIILPEYDYNHITEIDDGDYQGTKIYLIPKDTYQPDIGEYLITHNYYGSCSGCDTLLSIQNYDDEIPNEAQVDEIPNEAQVNEYMQLCLHLIQRMRILGDKENE